MTRPPTDREALIAALAEEARSGVTGEPEPEELLEFLAGRLSPEDERHVDRQLIASPEATRALLDLQDLEAAGAAAGTQPTELAMRAGWRDLQGRLPASMPWYRRLPPVLSSIAAALLLSTMSLLTYVMRLREELILPVANVVSLPLLSNSRAASEERATVPPGAPLRLVLRPAEHCALYDAQVERPERRQTVSGLKPNEQGNLVLELPRAQPGSYGLRLFGCEPRHEIEAHRFRVTAP